MMTRNRRPSLNRPSKSRKLARIRAPIIGAPADFHSAARSRIGNSGQKSWQPIKFRRSRPLSHNLALALLRIQFNAMNLTIRPRAAVYGFILTGLKFAIGGGSFFLVLFYRY